jgi:two-component system response regulator FixJ
MRILIADDEQRYRDFLRAGLAEHGHEVTTVDTGRVAIDYGVRYRPQVLVTDWMLANHIHGLRVSNVLRAVDPGLQTIMISGFPSADLERDAKHSGVFRFIEKPFEVSVLVEAVNGASAVKNSGQMALFGLLQVNATGRIIHRNCRARRMLADTTAGSEAELLEELFGNDVITYLVESNERWIRAEPASDRPLQWLMRSKTWPDGGLLVMLPSSSSSLHTDPLIATLLEIDEPRPVAWPFADHVLVIDDVREVRALCTQLLEQVGCVCYKAEDEELAVKLLHADTEIGVVLLDYDMSIADLGGFVATLESIRPGIKIVGTSAADLRDEFQSLGVDRYLDKGWRIEDLIEVVGG